jgi:3-carboxymuconate cyclase
MGNNNQTKGVEGRGAMNKLRILIGGLFIMLCMFVVGSLHIFHTDSAWISEAFGDTPARGKIVVANRASGTISVIDIHSDEVVDTIPLPAGPNPPEPMYVFYVPSHKRVFVNDRMNNRVVVFDARDFSVEDTVDTGAGPFHIWGIGRRDNSG